jgi:hypothetical protein
VPVIFGGGDESLHLFPILSKIKQRLDSIKVSSYGDDLSQIVVLLCFSGEIYRYTKTKVGKTRFELKRKRASVEYFFAPLSFLESETVIGTAIIDSLRTLASNAQKKGLSFDWTGLINDVNRKITA